MPNQSDDIDPIEAVIKDLYKKIEDLEKKYDDIKGSDSAWMGNTMAEITELREREKNHTDCIVEHEVRIQNIIKVLWDIIKDDSPERIKQIKAMDRQMSVEVGTHIFVKREKIEFWRKEMLNKTDEVLKSMREVLGIE